jgi:anti-sigma regulatory factor (Ser/Thr protein kinase)
MSGRADVVYGSPRVDGRDPEHGSGVGPASTRGPRVTTTAWPSTSSLVLGALPTAPSCARLHAGAVLHEWGLANLAETVELVVSELMTNAIQAATEPAARAHIGLPVVYLRLLADRTRVVIEVWDSNPQTPTPKQAEPDEESGRGLMLVEALCERWSWEVVPGWDGKVVWAELLTK